ncbi:MAG: alpha/beta hydrolase fold domain-containing protein [Nocardioidaceae bacterium]
MPSLQHQLLTRLIPVIRGRSEVRDPQQLRRDVLAAQQRAQVSPPRRVAARFDVRHEEPVDGSGLPCFEVRAPRAQPQRTVLYLHGGGFVSGLDRFHWRYAARLAGQLGVRVVLPDYPLTPTYTWRDSLPALTGLFERLAVESPHGVVLMGDSAGGGLALALAQQVGMRSGPQPTHLIMFAPWVDLTGKTSGTDEAARQDPWLTLSKLKLYGNWWGAGNPHAPEGSPLFGDLSRLPPTMVLCGTRDLLAPQSRALVARTQQAGVPVTYVEEPGLLHVYPLLPVPEARRAFSQVTAFLNGHGDPA